MRTNSKLQNIAGSIINPATEDKQDTTIANQTNGTQKTQIIDSSGNTIGSSNNTQLKVTNYDSTGLEADVDLPKTAFGDLRVAELTPMFQSSFEYTVSNTFLNTNTVVEGGTVTQADAMAVLTSSTTTGSSALLQSYRHGRYRAGFGGLTRFTALFTTGVAATEQYTGMADHVGSTAAFKNGLMIGYDGTTFGVHRFQNDTKFTTALADCDDPLDGTGPSGMTLVKTNLNVFFIRYQYLGGGDIEFGVEDDTTGKCVVFHRIDYTNRNTVPSTYNPNYHFTIFVNNKATTSNLIMKTASYAYFVEGKCNVQQIHQPQFSTGQKEKTSVTTETAIFTIKCKDTYASKTNFIEILLENLNCSISAAVANNLASIRLVKNTTLGGTPSYADINTSDSVTSIDTAGTTVTGGTEILSIPLAGQYDKELFSLIGLQIILQDGETLTVSGTSSNSATMRASLLWKELF